MDRDSQREDVWYALSDLYLDEEVDDSRQNYIASILAETNYSIDEIEEILFQEVHPVLCWNITQVAGHWGDFGREWTVESVLNHLSQSEPKSWLQKLRAKGVKKGREQLKPIIYPTWQLIKSRIAELRSGSL